MLSRAIKKLEKGWTWGGGRDKWGHYTVDWCDKRTVRYCAHGAMEKAGLELGIEKDKVLDLIDEVHPCLWQFNDSHKKHEVLALLRAKLAAM